MILSFARQLQDKGYNPSRNLLVVAWDIDVLCTNMSYLQMCMYDIPASVTNGDTLALKANFTLFTPQYYIFNKLLQDGKLNIPICVYCGREIQGEVKKSELRFNAEVCNDCYKTEKMLLALKQLAG